MKESQKCNSCDLKKDNFIEFVDDLPFLHLFCEVRMCQFLLNINGTVFSFYTFYLTYDHWSALIYLSFTKVFESSAGDFKWAWFHQLGYIYSNDNM